MSYEDPTQVVVIEDQRRRRMLPWVAGAAAIALLATGGTFALWRASAQFTGGQVTAGDLDLTGCDTLEWYDISPDRFDVETISSRYTGSIDFSQSILLGAEEGDGSINEFALAAVEDTTDEFTNEVSWTEGEYPAKYTTYVGNDGVVKGHPIDDISTWRMVPGDTVLAVCGGGLITLEGDNLVAALTLDSESDDPIDFGDLVGVVGGYEIYVPGEDGPSLYDPTALAEPGVLGYFGAPKDGQDAGQAEGSQVYALTAQEVESALIDLRDDTPGRESLGQGPIALIFAIHFVDDGVDDYGWECSDAEYSTQATCEEADEVWTYGVKPNNDDIDVEGQNRYLATKQLADIAGGHLGLHQVRTAVGAYSSSWAPVAPSPSPSE